MSSAFSAGSLDSYQRAAGIGCRSVRLLPNDSFQDPSCWVWSIQSGSSLRLADPNQLNKTYNHCNDCQRNGIYLLREQHTEAPIDADKTALQRSCKADLMGLPETGAWL
jgi:hypothetical protein